MKADLMRIAIIGGTGNFGKGLALRWVKNHDICIISRDPNKAREKARSYANDLKISGGFAGIGKIEGTQKLDVLQGVDVVVLTLKFEHLTQALEGSARFLGGKTVLCPIVSMVKAACFQYAPPVEGSCALSLQKALPQAAVVAALHTIPAHRLQNATKPIEGDVPVCGDLKEPKKIIMGLVREIENLNPVDAGPLEVSTLAECVVPLILNVKQYTSKKDMAIKFV